MSEIITANQEVYDAIYAEQGDVDTSVRFSTDGVEWSDVDVEFPVPDNLWSDVRTTADRFVIVANPEVPGVDPGPEPQSVEVYSSTDLVNWEVQQIPLPVPPTDLGPAESFMPYFTGVAVTDRGFMATIQVSVDSDPVQLLDAETRERVHSSPGGFGVNFGDDGVTIELFGPDPVVGTSPSTRLAAESARGDRDADLHLGGARPRWPTESGRGVGLLGVDLGR